MAEIEPQFSDSEISLGQSGDSFHKDIKKWFKDPPTTNAKIHVIQHGYPTIDGGDKIINFRPSAELFTSNPAWEPSYDDGEDYPLAANED